MTFQCFKVIEFLSISRCDLDTATGRNLIIWFTTPLLDRTVFSLNRYDQFGQHRKVPANKMFAVIPVGIVATDKNSKSCPFSSTLSLYAEQKWGRRVCAFCACIAAIFKVKVAECVPYARVDNSARTRRSSCPRRPRSGCRC
jgi:hypothetical protein